MIRINKVKPMGKQGKKLVLLLGNIAKRFCSSECGNTTPRLKRSRSFCQGCLSSACLRIDLIDLFKACLMQLKALRSKGFKK